MNIKDWQMNNEERKRRSEKPLPQKGTEGTPLVQARLDVLAAELAAITTKTPDEENAAKNSES